MRDTHPVSEDKVELVRQGFLAAMEENWPVALATLREDAGIYRVEDGKIVRLEYFNDQRQALDAAGLAG